MTMNATVLNRDPYVNLTTQNPSVYAGQSITFNASDSGDIDTISPEGQHVTISWPNSTCEEGLYGPYCTLTPEVEGMNQIEVFVIDDDGASVSEFLSYEVLNVAPTIGEMIFSVDGIPYLPDENGTWTIDEDIVATLETDADDTLSDKEGLLVTWYPDSSDENWTITTSGPSSQITASWGTSGLHEIKAFAIDDDGETSFDVIGYVNVNNIAPVLGVLPQQKTIGEDEILNLTASATDFADQDDLRFCWDLVATVDSDNNGIMTDDCDFEGQNLVYSWTVESIRTVTANVWDDDNATDSFSIAVSVRNLPPKAKITSPPGGFVITEGDSITFDGSNSSDTTTDRTILKFTWDDPNTKGAMLDGSGETFTIKFDEPGEYRVNLTVTDDDGDTAFDYVMVKVKAKPSEGLFGMTTPTLVGGIFGIVIIVLLGILLVRRRGSNEDQIQTANMSDYGWNDSPPSVVESPPVSAPVAPPMGIQEPVNTGPPLPASGLPEGWTMEQWEYYGEQYLASMPPMPTETFAQPAQTAYQPEPAPTYNPAPTQTFAEPAPSLLERTMVQEPAPTPASQALADILDDLDL